MENQEINTQPEVQVEPVVETPAADVAPQEQTPVEIAPEQLPSELAPEPSFSTTTEIALKEGELAILREALDITQKGISKLSEERDILNHQIAEKEQEIAQLSA